jgi:HPt (histidine-containing phosphotransfer) domain-containing protein
MMSHVANDRQLFVHVLNLFLQGSIEVMVRIRKAVAAHDPEAIAMSAHALKGSAATIGAERVRKVAGDLERMGRSGEIASAKTLMSNLENTFAELLPVIRPLADKSRTQAAD